MNYRRYFVSDVALKSHFLTKPHKRRLKALEFEPYSIEESERAAGKGSYVAPKKRKIDTVTRESFAEKDSNEKANTESRDASAMKIANDDL